jgi:hypothetical protein
MVSPDLSENGIDGFVLEAVRGRAPPFHRERTRPKVAGRGNSRRWLPACAADCKRRRTAKIRGLDPAVG